MMSLAMDEFEMLMSLAMDEFEMLMSLAMDLAALCNM